jgi:hypothetical protein
VVAVLLVQHQPYGTVVVCHHDIDVAVIVQVAEGGATADFGEFERVAG